MNVKILEVASFLMLVGFTLIACKWYQAARDIATLRMMLDTSEKMADDTWKKLRAAELFLTCVKNHRDALLKDLRQVEAQNAQFRAQLPLSERPVFSTEAHYEP